MRKYAQPKPSGLKRGSLAEVLRAPCAETQKSVDSKNRPGHKCITFTRSPAGTRDLDLFESPLVCCSWLCMIHPLLLSIRFSGRSPRVLLHVIDLSIEVTLLQIISCGEQQRETLRRSVLTGEQGKPAPTATPTTNTLMLLRFRNTHNIS